NDGLVAVLFLVREPLVDCAAMVPCRSTDRCCRRLPVGLNSLNLLPLSAPAKCRRTLENIMAKAWDARRRSPLGSVTAEYQRSICSAQTERIRQRGVDIACACLVWDQVDRRVDRRIVEIDRGWHNPIANGKDGENRFDSTGRAKQVPDAGFGR